MEIPGLGSVTKDEKYGWYYSGPISLPVLGGQACRIVVEGYDDDPAKEDFHVAVKNFLALDQSALKDATAHVFQYYQDCAANSTPGDDDYVMIEKPEDVWEHVRFGDEPVVSRRYYGDEGVYVSLSCGCDWEEEHGLQIVFKHGLKINKVGPYDGHLTNADAYGDDGLEKVIYR